MCIFPKETRCFRDPAVLFYYRCIFSHHRSELYDRSIFDMTGSLGKSWSTVRAEMITIETPDRLRNVIVSVIFAIAIPLGIPRCNSNSPAFSRGTVTVLGNEFGQGWNMYCNCNHQKMNWIQAPKTKTVAFNNFDDEARNLCIPELLLNFWSYSSSPVLILVLRSHDLAKSRSDHTVATFHVAKGRISSWNPKRILERTDVLAKFPQNLKICCFASTSTNPNACILQRFFVLNSKSENFRPNFAKSMPWCPWHSLIHWQYSGFPS